MAFPEQPIQPSESFGHDPHSAGDSSGSIDRTGAHNPGQDVEWDERFKSLADESSHLQQLYAFESKLKESGYLSRLEQTGVLPPLPEHPNPYSFLQEPEEHLLWALQHQEETVEYMMNVRQREEILRYLYIGATIQDWSTQR